MSSPSVTGKQRGKLPADVRLGHSGVHGYGLFARDFIAKEARIIEYLGDRITKAEAERREALRLARLAAGKDGCVYIFELNKRYDIDGNLAWNQARRINHSCAPNCETQNIRGHIWIIASRDIAPDEELNFDYGFGYSEWQDHPCRCGAKECVGYIVNSSQRWRVRRALAKKSKPTAAVASERRHSLSTA